MSDLNERWEVSHKGGAAWWADRGNTALGPFENRDVAAMVVNNLNDVPHLDHKKAAEYWINRACDAEDKANALEAKLAAAKAERDLLVDDAKRLANWLEWLMEWQNGPPLESYKAPWTHGMERGRAALDAHRDTLAAFEREKTVAPGHAVLAKAIADARDEAMQVKQRLQVAVDGQREHGWWITVCETGELLLKLHCGKGRDVEVFLDESALPASGNGR